jgi:hypothetical protein
VERRKPEEFAAQQASGGGDNSDEDEDVPAASGSGTNSGGAPITASGNMSLRGRDEWKEVTIPSYEHLPSPVDNGDRAHQRAFEGERSNIGPVDPRLYDRPSAMSGPPFHPDHEPAMASYRMNPRASEEILEQQRRAEQYRFLQMQAQMGHSGPPYTGHNGNQNLHLNGSGAPSWMGMGRNRQRSDIGEGMEPSREQLTSWAAVRDSRTPSAPSLPMTAGSQPAMNALYNQRLNAPRQDLPSPSAPGSMANGPGMHHRVSPDHRHGLPAENVSAGDFADLPLNSGIDFYTPYHLPTAQGMNPDGTLDWQRTAAAAQLQAALQAQQAQLAYLRQQKAQQLQWKELVAASGMDFAVNQFGARMGAQGAQGGLDQGQYSPQDLMPFQSANPTDNTSAGSSSAPPTGGFSWPGDGNGGAQLGSWYNNLNQQPSSLRTDVRAERATSSTRGAEEAVRAPSVSGVQGEPNWDPADAGDAHNLRSDGHSGVGSQEDGQPAAESVERKRQNGGDLSENEQESKRSRVA